jgi:hypothetical protein
MSIIEEALRRAQGSASATPPQTSPVQGPKVAPAPETRAPAHSWQAPPAQEAPGLQPAPLNVVALAILVLTVGLIIGGAYWMGRSFRSGAAVRQATIHPAASAERAESPARKPAKRQAPAGKAIVLSGVVEGSGEPYAVINGEIYAVGERIGDATLGTISNGAVTLRHDNGRETVLRVPR